MRDQFKVAGSLVAATIVCLIAVAAPRAQDARRGEIIETDFLSAVAPLSGDGEASPVADSTLPAADPSFQPVPVELIGDLAPLEIRRQAEGSGGADVASSGGDGSAASGSGGDSGSGDSGSGDSGSGDSGSGDSGSGDSGSGDSGSGDSGSGDSGGDSGGGNSGGGQGGGKGHGKGGSKK